MKAFKGFISPLVGWLLLLGLGGPPAIALEYGDVIMNTKVESMGKANVGPVTFPHWFHRIRYKCKACHEAIFVMGKGVNDVNMKMIMAGESCGVCHNGAIAFEPLYCERCHATPVKAAVGESGQ